MHNVGNHLLEEKAIIHKRRALKDTVRPVPTWNLSKERPSTPFVVKGILLLKAKWIKVKQSQVWDLRIKIFRLTFPPSHSSPSRSPIIQLDLNKLFWEWSLQHRDRWWAVAFHSHGFDLGLVRWCLWSVFLPSQQLPHPQSSSQAGNKERRSWSI